MKIIKKLIQRTFKKNSKKYQIISKIIPKKKLLSKTIMG